jgi:hypothetical protein
MHRSAFKNDKAAAEVFIGAGSLPQAHMTEFGTAKMAPRPWARPVWDAHKGTVLLDLGSDLWTEIEAAAARRARKAARLLAKAAGNG